MELDVSSMPRKAQDVQEEEAIEYNFGQGPLNSSVSSAYMLIYIRCDAAATIRKRKQCNHD